MRMKTQNYWHWRRKNGSSMQGKKGIREMGDISESASEMDSFVRGRPAKNRQELNLQGEVIQSIRRERGYCRKLSSKYLTGIPDLLMGLYPFIPCLAEVKDLGIMPDKFSRKVMVTPRQHDEMKRLTEAYEPFMRSGTQKDQAALLFVGWTWGSDRWLTVLPYGTHHVTSDALATKRQKGGLFPIRAMLTQFGQLAQVDRNAP